MTVWSNIAHHNENVKSVKSTMKIAFVTKNVQAKSIDSIFFQGWTKKKRQNIPKNIVE